MSKKGLAWTVLLVVVAAAAWFGGVGWHLTVGRHLAHLVSIENGNAGSRSLSEQEYWLNPSQDDRDLYAAWDYWTTCHPGASISKGEVESAVNEWNRVVTTCQAADEKLDYEQCGVGKQLWLIYSQESEQGDLVTSDQEMEGFKRAKKAIRVDAWRRASPQARRELGDVGADVDKIARSGRR